MSIHNILPFS